jgi:hypothetical protein
MHEVEILCYLCLGIAFGLLLAALIDFTRGLTPAGRDGETSDHVDLDQ